MSQNIIATVPLSPVRQLQNRGVLRLKRWILVTLLFLTLAFIGYLSTLSLLKIDMDAMTGDQMQVYWANEQGDFSEAQSSTTRVKRGRHNYWFWVKDFNKSTRFRVDPATQEMRIKIYNIQLYSLHYYPAVFDLLNDLVQSSDIQLIDQSLFSDKASIEIMSLGDDPQLQLKPVLVRSPLVFIFTTILLVGLFFRKFSFAYTGSLCIAFIFLYNLLGYNEMLVSFRAHSEQGGQIKLLWLDVGEEFSSTRTRSVTVLPGTQNYTVKISSINNIELVKLEAGKNHPPITLEGVTFKESGFKQINFSQTDLQEINTCLQESKSSDDFNGDPCRDLAIIAKQVTLTGLLVSVAWFLGCFGGLLWVIFYYLKTKRFFYTELFPKLIQASFLLATFLVINLAWQADYNIHPDEEAHAESIKYYSQYWDPPTVGDPRALGSYQAPWAISRLNDLGISYFIAGKFRALVQFIFTDESFIARAFNAFLFLMFFVMSRDKRCLLFLVPLLCSPQIWYLYAYANRGGFVLFISVLLAWQLVHKKSALNTFLNTDKPLAGWRSALFPGLLLGILSIEQTNYLLFILFVFAVLLWELLFFVKQKKVFLYKCLFFLLIGISVFSVRYAIDVSINGTDKMTQKIAYAEEHAEPAFKPSIASTAESYSGLRLRDKGVSLTEIFQPEWQWHKMTFKSFTGFYGYYAEYSPRWYYAYVLLIYVIVLLVVLKHAIFEANWRYKLFTALTLIAISGGILMGLLFSWLYDFQPQGRYIFPIIPIMLVYFWKMFPLWKRLEKALILTSVIALIILSFYSFNEVALNYLFA